MVKLARDTKIALAIMLLTGAMGLLLLLFARSKVHEPDKQIAAYTDEWIDAVTKARDPKAVAKLFCTDGRFVGSFTKVKIEGDRIEDYFDYFTGLPELEVVSKRYDIQELTPDVYINNAFITWTWDGRKEPLTVRMSFIFAYSPDHKKHCIFQLRTSATTGTHTYTRKNFQRSLDYTDHWDQASLDPSH